MVRTVRNSKIDSRSARAKLPVQKSVHWVTISRGFALGYRKGIKGGAWLAKLVRDGVRNETTLGTADDVLDANGATILDYGQAQESARTWLKALERAADTAPASNAYTVKDALDDYLQDYKRRSGKAYKDIKARIDSQIDPALGKLLITKLTKKRLRDWHGEAAEVGARLRTRKDKQQKYREFDQSNEEIVRRRRATANRLLTILKAALNFAVTEGKIETDSAWRHVKPFRNVDVPKIRYLTLKECKSLVEKADEDFKPMCQAALLTGCRYGELTALTCADLDAANGTLFVRQSKNGKARHVILSDDGVAFFRATIGTRASQELIFQRPDGKPWGKSHQHRPIKEACKGAGIVPAVSFHVLRHTYASHLVMSGASLQVVATNLGHADTRITERHYAHLSSSHIAAVIRNAMPNMNILDRARLKIVA